MAETTPTGVQTFRSCPWKMFLCRQAGELNFPCRRVLVSGSVASAQAATTAAHHKQKNGDTMSSATLDGRVTMDPAAFAQFCETHSMAMCGPGAIRSWGHIAVDAYDGKIMLEADRLKMRDRGLMLDLHKAAQAGRVDGAFSGWVDRSTRLEMVVFRNSETWAGWADCLNKPVDIGPCATRRIEVPEDDTLDLFQRVEGSATKHRVHRFGALRPCFCGEWLDDDDVCLNDGEVWTTNGVPIIDVETFWPVRATGQLEQVLDAAAGFVGPEGRRELGRLIWNVAVPGQQNMFRRWLETIEEATGERYVTWMPDLFDIGLGPWYDDGPVAVDKRPVCADTGVTQRVQCPAFLISDTATSDTIRVPAHVDNVSLANAAKLAAGGADPAEAVAIIAAITHPDRR